MLNCWWGLAACGFPLLWSLSRGPMGAGVPSVGGNLNRRAQWPLMQVSLNRS